MKRNFECWHCHKTFEADDQQWVQCPHCESDNVEYATWHAPRWLGRALSIAAAIVLVAIAAYYVATHFPQKEVEQTETVIEEDDTTGIHIDIPSDIVEPPTLEVSELTFEDEGYTFEVTVNNAPAQKYVFAIYDAFDDKKLIMKDDDGKFEGVPYSEAEGGSYRLAILDATADTLLCSFKTVPGFIRQEKPEKKMSVAQLQAMIDARDESLLGLGENKYLAPDYKIKFVGLPKGAKNVPTILAEVNEKIDNFVWDSAKVTALEYDDMNRICLITMKVVVGDGF